MPVSSSWALLCVSMLVVVIDARKPWACFSAWRLCFTFMPNRNGKAENSFDCAAADLVGHSAQPGDLLWGISENCRVHPHLQGLPALLGGSPAAFPCIRKASARHGAGDAVSPHDLPGHADGVDHRAPGTALGHVAHADPLWTGLHAGNGVQVHSHSHGGVQSIFLAARIKGFPSLKRGILHPVRTAAVILNPLLANLVRKSGFLALSVECRGFSPAISLRRCTGKRLCWSEKAVAWVLAIGILSVLSVKIMYLLYFHGMYYASWLRPIYSLSRNYL